MSLNNLYHLSCILVTLITSASYFSFLRTAKAYEKRIQQAPTTSRDPLFQISGSLWGLTSMSALLCVCYTIAGLELAATSGVILWSVVLVVSLVFYALVVTSYNSEIRACARYIAA